MDNVFGGQVWCDTIFNKARSQPLSAPSASTFSNLQISQVTESGVGSGPCFLFLDAGRRKCRRVFHQAEDEDLAGLVDKFGTENWEKVAEFMPDRTPRQCRDRWNFYVRPSVNRAP
jgi:hypothetical protein